MRISGPDVTNITGSPGAGNSFGYRFPWASYVGNYTELFYNKGLMVSISPPVLNSDNTTVFSFPNPGGDDMNARQTAGLWVSQSSDAKDFTTEAVVFDQKVGLNTLTHITTITPYVMTEGGDSRVSTTINITGSFITGSTSPSEINIPAATVGQGAHYGTNVDNYNSYAFSPLANVYLQLLAYENQWGTDNPANYGPFNFSSADLLPMSSYLNDGGGGDPVVGPFGSLSYERSARSDARGPVKLTRSPNPDAATDDPVLMDITSSVSSRFFVDGNVHVSYSKIYTYGV